MTDPVQSHCQRCKRPNPEASQGTVPTDWEVLTGEAGEVLGVICPGCVTAVEEQAMDEEAMEDLDEIARRQEFDEPI